MQRIKLEKAVVLLLQMPFGLRIPQTRTLFLRKGLLLAEIVPVAAAPDPGKTCGTDNPTAYTAARPGRERQP